MNRPLDPGELFNLEDYERRYPGRQITKAVAVIESVGMEDGARYVTVEVLEGMGPWDTVGLAEAARIGGEQDLIAGFGED